MLILYFIALGRFNLRIPPPYISLTEDLEVVINWFSKRDSNTRLELKSSIDSPTIKSYMPKTTINEYTGKYAVNSAVINGTREAFNNSNNSMFYYQIIELKAGGSWDDPNARSVKFGGKDLWIKFPQETFPQKDLKIVALGDLQPKSFIPPLLQWRIMSQVAKSNPDLFLFLGDHTMEGIDPVGWKHYFHLIGKIARNTPVLGVPGNHDTKLSRNGGVRDVQSAYKTFVNYPDPKSRYFLNVYGIQVLAFDFHSGFAEGSANLKLFDQAINNIDPKKWTIVLWHSSPYNTLRPNDQVKEQRSKIIPALNEKGCKLWLGGHEHSYQKFKVQGTYYITSAATSSFHDHHYVTENMELLEMQFHYLTLDITRKEILVKAISWKNKVIDEFTIDKY